MARRRPWWMLLPVIGTVVALGLGVSACGGAPAERQEDAPSSSQDRERPKAGQSVAGTIVHFTAGDVVVQAVIEKNNPTTRSFIAMLPMALTFSDFGGKEKVSSPSHEFDFTDAKGMRPEVGDLFSYKPWGNLGFFYNTDGNTFSDSLIKIGTTDDIDQIKLLDGEEVTIDIAARR